MIECDVLVVGAGPAGSSAARASEKAGAKTILIEKKDKPGKPACGETISKVQLGILPFKIPNRFLKWPLNGFCFHADGIQITKTNDILWEAFTIERKDFEPWLAKNAVNEGATFLNNTELIDIEHDNCIIKKAIVKTPTGKVEIVPKIVISAEGVNSTIPEIFGVKKIEKWSIGQVLSWEMKNLKLEKPNMGTVYLGEYSEGGYAYILPKSKDTANVGVATAKEGADLQKCYKLFTSIPEVKRQIENGIKVVDRSGKAPIKYTMEKWTYGNVLFAGDTATQNFKPFVEGILPSIICGDIAGTLAAEHLYKKTKLDEYRPRIYEKLGEAFEESDMVTEFLMTPFDYEDERRFLIELGIFTEFFNEENMNIETKSYDDLKKELILFSEKTSKN